MNTYVKESLKNIEQAMDQLCVHCDQLHRYLRDGDEADLDQNTIFRLGEAYGLVSSLRHKIAAVVWKEEG